jgi:hypothetical protein
VLQASGTLHAASVEGMLGGAVCLFLRGTGWVGSSMKQCMIYEAVHS